MNAKVRNLNINYEVMGEGKPLLILHGWGSEALRWQKTAEYLTKKGFKIIIPDLPGFGKSQKPNFIWGLDEYCSFLKDFADELNLNNFYLLGHSFGGSLAAKYAIRYPADLRKLFLVGAACVRKRTLKKRIVYFLSKLFKHFSKILILKKAFYRYVVRSDYPSSAGIMKEIYLKVIRQSLLEQLENITTSTVLIWGEKDNITPMRQGRLINQRIKNSKIKVIKESDHSPHLACPDKLADLIADNK